MLNLNIEGKEYQAKLFESTTKDEITAMLPLKLTMTRCHSWYGFGCDKGYSR